MEMPTQNRVIGVIGRARTEREYSSTVDNGRAFILLGQSINKSIFKEEKANKKQGVAVSLKITVIDNLILGMRSWGVGNSEERIWLAK